MKNKISKLQSNQLVLKSSFVALQKKALDSMMITEQQFLKAVQRKNKEEASQIVNNYAKCQLKEQAFKVIMNALETYKQGIPALAAAKTIPDSLLYSLRVLCVVSDIFPSEYTQTFKNLIKSHFGNDVLQNLSNPMQLTPDFKEMFSEKQNFTQTETMATIIYLDQKLFNKDMKPLDFLIGPQNQPSQNPQPNFAQFQLNPNSPPIEYGPPPSNPLRSHHADIPPPPVFTPASLNYIPEQFRVDYPQMPNYPTIAPPPTNLNAKVEQPQNPQNRIFYQELQNLGQMCAAVNNYGNQIHYPPHPDICYPMDLPVFPREIWTALSQDVNTAVS